MFKLNINGKQIKSALLPSSTNDTITIDGCMGGEMESLGANKLRGVSRTKNYAITRTK